MGEWIPEPLPEPAEWISGRPGGALGDPADRVTLDESVSMAFPPHPLDPGATVIAGQAAGHVTFLERTVNGQPGLVAEQDSAIVAVFAFDLAGGRVKHIWAVRNPDKLRPWTARSAGWACPRMVTLLRGSDALNRIPGICSLPVSMARLPVRLLAV